jgi:hypothetical protein
LLSSLSAVGQALHSISLSSAMPFSDMDRVKWSKTRCSLRPFYKIKIKDWTFSYSHPGTRNN